MIDTTLFKVMMRELLTFNAVERVPEAEQVMRVVETIEAFAKGREINNCMFYAYLFNAAQITDVICPGDHVIDLACGPASQLALAARFNRDVKFTGIDLSDEMLEVARLHISESGLANVSLCRGDITDLCAYADGSIDAVISTFSVHHLNDLESLGRLFAEVARVLKPDGGIYIQDLCRLKSLKSMELMRDFRSAGRHRQLVEDYYHSMRAAFSEEDFKRVVNTYLPERAQVYSPLGLKVALAVKSPVRRTSIDASVQREYKTLHSQLFNAFKLDLRSFQVLFSLGGMRSHFLG